MFLFKKKHKTEKVVSEETPSTEKLEKESLQFPNYHRGMIVEIYDNEFSELLLDGQIAEDSEDFISIIRNIGVISLPVVEENTSVGVRVYNRDLKPINLIGCVRKSSRVNWVVDSLTEMPYIQKRADYRIPLSCPAQIIQQGAVHHHTVLCTILNIGLGGVLIRCDAIFQVDEEVKLQFSLVEGAEKLTYSGQILRTRSTKNGVEYAILFARMSESEQSHLMQMMNRYQAKIKNSY